MNPGPSIRRSFLDLSLVILIATAAHAADSPRVALKLVAEGFAAPIVLTSLPDGSGRLLVADQAGIIYLISKEGEKKTFLDVRPKMVTLNQGMEERGITGLALHPDFKSNQKFYVAYNVPKRASAPPDWDNTMRVSEFRTASDDAASVKPDSERVILEIDKPDWNHNSGRIAFGPDGLLYVSVGDGGAPNDVGRRGHAPEGNGQNLQTLLGKILRIDVNRGSPYEIPKDNPFADGKRGRPEIYAYGLRNPWGMSFDRGGSHDLIVADVGQDRWEEVDVIVNGGNYGWRVREGYEGFDPKNPKVAPTNAPVTGADGKPFVDPVLVYKTFRGLKEDPDSFGASITGGYLYRGKSIPDLAGKYVFGDWSHNMGYGDGMLLVATRPEDMNRTRHWKAAPLAAKDLASGKDYPTGRIRAYLWAFGEDSEGELYVLTNGANMVNGDRGKVYKLVPP